jgi:hypothetical protein
MEDWDYKGKVGPQGEALPDDAIGWTPRGDPYFGPGFQGTLKKWNWRLKGKPGGNVGPADWDRYDELVKARDELQAGGDKPGAVKASWAALVEGATQGFKALDWFASEEKAEGEEGKPGFDVAGALRTPLRLTTTGIQAALDAFSEFAIKQEQVYGAGEAARGASEGSPLPDIGPSEAVGEQLGLSDKAMRNIELLANVSPVVFGYNALRFLTAPKSWEEKKDIVAEGFDAGRILYSSVLNPALTEQFKQRAASGEDPQLLAMELEDPWAEMAGQVILDPLNVLTFLAKGMKSGKVLQRATQEALQQGDEFADGARALKSLPESARVDATKKLIDIRTKAVEATREARLTSKYGTRAMSVAGNIQRVRRDMESFLYTGLSNILRGNGSLEDVSDWLRHGVMSTSKVGGEMLEGIAGLVGNKAVGSRAQFSEYANETFLTLRNLLTDDAGKVDVDHVARGLAGKTQHEAAEWLENLTKKAVHNNFPTIDEMESAAKAVASGKATRRQTEVAAALSNMSSGDRAFLKRVDAIQKIQGPINKVLGFFYFNSPGFGIRNGANNFLTGFIDNGAKLYFQDGKYWSLESKQAYLNGWGAGLGMPVETSGFKTQIAALGGAEGKSKLLPSTWSAKLEENSATTIYWSRFKQTIDDMLQPGRALPRMEEFASAGFSQDQVKHFIRALKDNYGDVNKTVSEMFTGRQDSWRMYELFADDNVLKGLKEQGITDELADLVRDPTATRESIATWFDKRIREAKKRASSASGGMPHIDPRAKENLASYAQLSDEAGETGNDFANVIGSSFRAQDEYISALADALKKHGNTMPPEARDGIIDFLKQTGSEAPRHIVRDRVQGMLDNMWEATNEVRKGADPSAWWGKVGMPGEMPAAMQKQDFLNAAWTLTKQNVSHEWDTFFDDVFHRSEALAQEIAKYDPEVGRLFTEAQELTKKANLLRGIRGGPAAVTDIAGMTADDAVRSIGIDFGAAPARTGWKNPTAHDKKLLSIVNKNADQKFENIADVPHDVAREAFGKWRAGQLEPAGQLVREGGPTITPPMMWNEVSKGTVDALQKLKTQMLSRFGMKHPDNFSPARAADFLALNAQVQDRVAETKFVASKVGKYWRDFALHAYGETTNLDVQLAMAFPYQFWYNRTYANWLKRAATDSAVIANYARLKDTLAGVNKDAPEWYRYNVKIPEHFLGLPNEHPFVMNMEATLWPLYGLTGVDFNDPAKRVDWLSATLDDMGKFGPSLWAPVQMAMAAGYSMKGQEETASHWGGRIIPQTQVVKSVSSWFGKPIELDPGVLAFSGGIDPYERNRVGRALGAMVQEDPSLEEAALEAARSQSGPLWDEAYRRAVQLRAPGAISSFLLGTGFKARTPEDIEIDQFYSDMYYIRNVDKAGNMSPEQYRASMDGLRQKYPFMDTVLLSKKAGPERDKAYAYNVLGRIPPGEMSGLLEAVGVNSDVVSQFYDNKGDMSKWGEGDRSRFMAAVLDLGAILEMPDDTNRAEWTLARGQYQDMRKETERRFGGDIWTKMDTFYELMDRDRDGAYAFLDANPEVQGAFNMKDTYVVNTPLLSKYYGGLDVIQRYVNGQERARLTQKYGNDIYDLYYAYLDLLGDEKKKFKRDNPQLAGFMDEKYGGQDAVNERIIALGQMMPERSQVPIRPGDLTSTQRELAGLVNAPQGVRAQELIQQMSLPLQALVAEYFSGEELHYAAKKQLDYLGERYGMSADEVLQVLGVGR